MPYRLQLSSNAILPPCSVSLPQPHHFTIKPNKTFFHTRSLVSSNHCLSSPTTQTTENDVITHQFRFFHRNGNGQEPWLNDHADFDRVFVARDSAGGNISHNLDVRVGSIGLPGVKLVGTVLVHPFFGGTDDDAMWLYMCRDSSGLQDEPAAEDLRKLGCGRVLVFVAEKDHLNGVGKSYVEDLQRSGWGGSVEIVENEGEDHCFHLEDLKYDKAVELIKRFALFIKQPTTN